jgi:hypothetical protein
MNAFACLIIHFAPDTRACLSRYLPEKLEDLFELRLGNQLAGIGILSQGRLDAADLL